MATNTPRGLALRGINGLPFAFAMENQMEMLAARVGMDSLEFRLGNAFEVGSRTHTGQTLEESVGIKDTLEALRGPYMETLARAKSDPPPSPWKRGVGMGCSWKSTGSPGAHKPGGELKVNAALELLEDGAVRVFAGAVEKGQGIRTVLAQIAGEQLGLPLHSVVVTMGDTSLAPYPHTTSAQGTTTLVGGALFDASRKLRDVLAKAAADILDERPGNISLQGGYAHPSSNPDRKLPLAGLAAHLRERGIPTRYEGTFSWKNTKPIDHLTGQGSIADVYSYNAALAEVDVNEETGEVRVWSIVYAADAGKIINPLSYEGQCQGGVVFGLGLALKERYVHGVTRTLKEYNLPTIKDVPEKIAVLSIENHLTSMGPFGAKGGAEMTDVAPVPAIANVIANAIGARIYELPATPEKVLQALGKS